MFPLGNRPAAPETIGRETAAALQERTRNRKDLKPAYTAEYTPIKRNIPPEYPGLNARKNRLITTVYENVTVYLFSPFLVFPVFLDTPLFIR